MKTTKENIINTLMGKKVLFLENDNYLDNGLETLESVLKDAGIQYTVLFNLSKLPIQQVLDEINTHDCIVFQTQWVTSISHKLLEFVQSLPEKKVVIEVYINEPTWFYHMELFGHHEVFIYKQDKHHLLPACFYKLTNIPFWNYKNKFDE